MSGSMMRIGSSAMSRDLSDLDPLCSHWAQWAIIGDTARAAESGLGLCLEGGMWYLVDEDGCSLGSAVYDLSDALDLHDEEWSRMQEYERQNQ